MARPQPRVRAVHSLLVTTALAATMLVAPAAYAQVTTIPQSALVPSTSLYTNDFGSPVVMNSGVTRNDDEFRGPINLGFTLNFFGQNYTQFYANNNGNVSFGNGISQFTPSGPQGASQPIISPFFADVDTRGTGSGEMMLRQDPNQIIVTWPGVGYYSSHADKLNTFQLVLRGAGFNVPAGEGQIGFFYTTMQWETGDASGGSGGFGGTPAAVGFGNGNSSGQVLQGSTQNGIAAALANHHIWFNLAEGGVPVEVPGGNGGGVSAVPEPSTYALLGLGLIGLFGAMRRRKS